MFPVLNLSKRWLCLPITSLQEEGSEWVPSRFSGVSPPQSQKPAHWVMNGGSQPSSQWLLGWNGWVAAPAAPSTDPPDTGLELRGSGQTVWWKCTKAQNEQRYSGTTVANASTLQSYFPLMSHTETHLSLSHTDTHTCAAPEENPEDPGCEQPQKAFRCDLQAFLPGRPPQLLLC